MAAKECVGIQNAVDSSDGFATVSDSPEYFIFTSVFHIHVIHSFIHSFIRRTFEEHSRQSEGCQRTNILFKEQAYMSSSWFWLVRRKILTTKYVLRVLMFTFNSHLTRAEVYKQTIANRWNWANSLFRSFFLFYLTNRADFTLPQHWLDFRNFFKVISEHRNFDFA